MQKKAVFRRMCNLRTFPPFVMNNLLFLLKALSDIGRILLLLDWLKGLFVFSFFKLGERGQWSVKMPSNGHICYKSICGRFSDRYVHPIDAKFLEKIESSLIEINSLCSLRAHQCHQDQEKAR